MTSSPEDKDLMLLLNAYLDGELDAITASQVERRIAAEPAAARKLAGLEALRKALRSDLADDVPPEALRQRIESLGRPARSSTRSFSWQALAASALIGALVAGGGAFGVLDYRQGSQLTDAVVASHIRALMAPQPTDVLSSDRHTVKPWFDGKLAFAPDVIDLAAQGFPLVGGRIDIVDFEPVPTLVYRANKHLISLTAIPGGARMIAPGPRDDRGFRAIAWNAGAVRFVAVSDAAPDEVSAFVQAFKEAAGGQ
jgi:anti-sigma factor RsiW